MQELYFLISLEGKWAELMLSGWNSLNTSHKTLRKKQVADQPLHILIDIHLTMHWPYFILKDENKIWTEARLRVNQNQFGSYVATRSDKNKSQDMEAQRTMNNVCRGVTGCRRIRARFDKLLHLNMKTVNGVILYYIIDEFCEIVTNFVTENFSVTYWAWLEIIPFMEH